MVDSPLAKKLALKPGYRALIMGAPEGYRALFGELPAGVELREQPDGPADFVHLFVRDRVALERDAPNALAALKPGGVLWLSYPKQSARVATDLTRDRGWDALTGAGWGPVSQVSIDAVWSALRFRPRL